MQQSLNSSHPLGPLVAIPGAIGLCHGRSVGEALRGVLPPSLLPFLLNSARQSGGLWTSFTLRIFSHTSILATRSLYTYLVSKKP